MRNFENANKFKKIGLLPHQIILATTSEPYYYMEKLFLIDNIEELKDDELLIIEGSHCSCYDFDETDWFGTIYTLEELKVLCKSNYNKDNGFWVQTLKHIGDYYNY